MSRRRVGSETRSDTPERVRFVWALLFSLLLHASVLMLRVGPPLGKGTLSAAAGGVIHATLRPAARESDLAPAMTVPPANEFPGPELPLKTILVAPTSPTTSFTASSPVAPAPSATTASAAAPVAETSPGSQHQGLDPATGPAGASDDPLAIPLLPPLPPLARPLPRRASLLVPLKFPYPSNIRPQGGRVRVRILVDEKGQVEEMRVVGAVPPGVFDEAALKVLRSGRFAPGFVGLMALRSYLFMDVTFGPGPMGQQLWYAGNTIAPLPSSPP